MLETFSILEKKTSEVAVSSLCVVPGGPWFLETESLCIVLSGLELRVILLPLPPSAGITMRLPSLAS